MTVSAQQKEVMETIKAVRMVKEELGVHTVLGVSNVSFGLPNRPLLNKTFLTMAMAAGLDLPIINPLDKELMDAIDAFNVLYNYDQDATIYIQNQSNQTVTSIKNTTNFTLEDIIIRGLKDEVKTATKKQLETKDGLEIINNILIPALDKVGKQYENNTIFLNSIEDICQRRIAFHKESLKEIIREIQIILEKNGASFNEEDIPELQNIIQIGRQKKLTL